ncbi:substrate-binding domain-containing protein [Microbacterium sp. MEC084]|uniref:LacI family DNA-binding transcriptional regulator n=1 Tax=Microbacterium sp. MEC084 TaxID=1963027 RepID=UPI00106FFF3A|nr:LacI family DNA-binding transcriptional regulator [Microbacterium sp. MEC084]MCD1267934.1 substrate-binding domain-containing protein [Microbacterium sp. MEC084]
MFAVPRSSSPAPSSRATRNDVARLAGVSPAVVSYVVNGTKKVGPDTEERVRAAVAKLGYRPNPSARALRLGSTEMLGMVMPSVINPYFAQLAHEVELAASKRGYTLITANSDSSIATERTQLEHLAARLVDGIFLCSNVFEPDLRDLELASIPVVLLNHSAETPARDSVGVDLLHGADLAVEHLASHGYDEVGIVIGRTSGDEEDGREIGWRESVDRLGLTPGPVARGPFSPDGGYDAMRRLLRAGTVPRALFVSSDQMGRGVLKAAHEAGLRVPEDLAIVSFDGSVDAAYSWPTLTSVAQPLSEMAEAAVEALLGPPHEPRHLVMDTRLVIGASCGCGPLTGHSANR